MRSFLNTRISGHENLNYAEFTKDIAEMQVTAASLIQA